MLDLSGSEGVRIVDPRGNEQGTLPVTGTTHAVAFGENGQVFVGQEDVVRVLGPEGDELRSWRTWHYDGKQHRFNDITDIAVMGGSVFVADGYNKRVHRFSPVGDFMLEFGGEEETMLIMPTAHLDVVPDREENALYVNNAGKNRVEVRKPNGELGLYWGEPGPHAQGFSGCCNPTDFDVMPNGYFVTAEKGIHRVKVYDRGGRMLAYLNRTNFTDPKDLGLDTLADGMDVAAESTERFYVTDPGSQQVLVFKRVKGSDEQQPETE
jgi:hypothetical protein